MQTGQRDVRQQEEEEREEGAGLWCSQAGEGETICLTFTVSTSPLYICLRHLTVMALIMKSLKVQSIVWLSRDRITIDLYDSFCKVNICDAFLCGIGFLFRITMVFEQTVRY